MKYTFTAVADNYEVPRGHLYGTLVTDQGYDGKSDVLIFEGTVKDAHKAIYVLDFGTRVEVRYVAGWNGNGGGKADRIFLQPFPLSVGTRSDGRPIDMSGWTLGPRRAYHLKLKEVSE